MLEVILDTETTGLSVADDHRIVEIGCIELKEQIATNKIFHEYVNPERPVSKDAYKIHGYSNEFLSKKKIFPEIADKFLEFIKDKKIIIHNAAFDLSFINYELKKINKKPLDKKNVIDTLEIARQKFPGSQNSLDALCKKYNIDNSKRDKHNALLDCKLLQKVYINLLGQKEPKLNLQGAEYFDDKYKVDFKEKYRNIRKIIKPTDKELTAHKAFLKSYLPKNNY